MSTLKSKHGQSLSTAIRNVSPIKFESVRIENKLLDGSIHLQTIGLPSKYVTFDLLANHTEIALLHLTSAIAEVVELSFDGYTYKGILKEINEVRINAWSKKKGNIFYIANGIRMDIVEEGLI